jgi:hypothetical protein
MTHNSVMWLSIDREFELDAGAMTRRFFEISASLPRSTGSLFSANWASIPVRRRIRRQDSALATLADRKYDVADLFAALDRKMRFYHVIEPVAFRDAEDGLRLPQPSLDIRVRLGFR